jgi:hypothetical protein
MVSSKVTLLTVGATKVDEGETKQSLPLLSGTELLEFDLELISRFAHASQQGFAEVVLTCEIKSAQQLA